MIKREAVQIGPDHWEVTVSCPYDKSTVRLTNDQFSRYYRWIRGHGLIQELLADLSADVREQLQTGIGPKKWDEIFPEEEEGMKLYRKRGLTRMEPWMPDSNMEGVTVDEKDRDRGSPQKGDMIAHDTRDGNRWLISKAYFEANYEEAQ